ncbi:MAG: hypothetical protein ACRDV9_13340 [Acidimicrobiia bacterium]
MPPLPQRSELQRAASSQQQTRWALGVGSVIGGAASRVLDLRPDATWRSDGPQPGHREEIKIPAATVPRAKVGKSFKDAVSP